jgi:hypothetical protein
MDWIIAWFEAHPIVSGAIFAAIMAFVFIKDRLDKRDQLKRDNLARQAGFPDEAALWATADDFTKTAFAAVCVLGDADASAEQRAQGKFAPKDLWRAICDERDAKKRAA